MSQSITEGRYNYNLHLPNVTSPRSLWRVPHWKDSTCAYNERGGSITPRARWCLGKGESTKRLGVDHLATPFFRLPI
jgi:hypothetical protein